MHGTAFVVVTGDELTVHVRATGLAPDVRHRQMIHVGVEAHRTVPVACGVLEEVLS